ncbi:DeoR/GlpR family DNA-binding transcription regulator [Bradyrhizobium sp.]|uniref:DeoR/GlpR family DNA-binding transcription regulator n=1 Tax=Bradyrhizobium sp. TaxID=376 RepID=UPI003C18BBA3
MGEGRRERLLDYLHRKPEASVEDLAQFLAVSKMTVHRDLDRLQELRVLRKTRGGATLLPSIIFEADYAFRIRQNRNLKQALAKAVAELVDPGMAVIIDDSSTTGAVLDELDAVRPLTVITNSLNLTNRLVKSSNLSVICLGGRYDPVTGGFFGLVCESATSRLRADLAIFSTAAVQGSSAYLHDQDVVRAKLAMRSAADRSVLVFDHTKIGKSALNYFSSLAQFDDVFVDDGVDLQHADLLRREKVNLKLVAAAAEIEGDRRQAC